MILSFPAISLHQNPFGNILTIYNWQYHVAGLGIANAWIINLIMVAKVPKLGIFIHMFMTIGFSFVHFFFAFISLLFAFGLSFAVLFPDEKAFASSPLITSPIKMLAMMTGELEYNDLYYPTFYRLVNDTLDDDTQNQIFPGTGHFLLTLFLIVVSLIIMNLLFGMAVTNVQELYELSHLNLSAQQVEIISYIESSIVGPWINKIGLKLWRHRGKFSPSVYEITVHLDTRNKEEKTIPSDLIDVLKNHLKK